jgi:hypothetical protein
MMASLKLRLPLSTDFDNAQFLDMILARSTRCYAEDNSTRIPKRHKFQVVARLLNKAS